MDVFKSYLGTILILVALNIFLSVLIGVTCHFWSLEKESYTRDSPFCLHCSEVLGHPDDGIPVGITKHENGTKCCAKDNAHLGSLIQAFANNWQDRKIHEENPTFSKCQSDKSEDKPLIKLVINDDQPLSNRDDVEWEETLTRSVGMVYGGGFVTVQETGLYYIYSQIGFQFNPLSAENPELPKQHIIGVREVGSSVDDYRLIAKGSNSQCKFSGQKLGQRHNSTSFIGTLYRLHKGDKVSIRVYDRSQIIPNKQMNFFGLHMV